MSTDLNQENNLQTALIPGNTIKTVIILVCFQLLQCSSGQEKTGPIHDFNAHEQIILSYYRTAGERKKAMRQLSARCRWKKKALSCYNLAVLKIAASDYEGARKAALKAVKISPDDNLYLGILQLTSIKTGRLEDLERLSPELHKFSRVIAGCGADNDSCIMNGFSNIRQGPKINFSKIYYEEKKRKNEFSGVWDTTWSEKGQKLPDTGRLETPLTEYWRDFRRFVKENNSLQAGKSFSQFKLELGRLQPRNRDLVKSITLAAVLLLEQDPFFKNFRKLAQELKDNG